jgi:hypothetical protein
VKDLSAEAKAADTPVQIAAPTATQSATPTASAAAPVSAPAEDTSSGTSTAAYVIVGIALLGLVAFLIAPLARRRQGATPDPVSYERS